MRANGPTPFVAEPSLVMGPHGNLETFNAPEAWQAIAQYSADGHPKKKLTKAQKADQFVGHFTRPVARHEAPALHEAVERLAQKAGIEKPAIHFFDHTKTRAHPFLWSMPYNCAATLDGEPRILVGKKLLEHFTGNENGQKMSPEMEAVIGHEFSHLKFDRNPYGVRKFSAQAPWAVPLTAIGALAIYHYYEKNADKQKLLEQKLTEPDQDLQLPLKNRVHPVVYASLVNAQYLAAAALGLAGGVMALRYGNRFTEFRADRFAAELLGDTGPVIETMEKLGNYPEHLIQQQRKDYQEMLNKTGMTPDQAQAHQWLQKQIGRITHPTRKERIERLRELKLPGAESSR